MLKRKIQALLLTSALAPMLWAQGEAKPAAAVMVPAPPNSADVRISDVAIRGAIEGENIRPEAFLIRLEGYSGAPEMLRPETKRAGRDVVSHRGSLAVPAGAALHVDPGEEGQHASGRADLIGKIEMIGPGVIEIDSLLDQALAEHIAVEIHVALRIARHGSDVMQTFNRIHSHLS